MGKTPWKRHICLQTFWRTLLPVQRQRHFDVTVLRQLPCTLLVLLESYTTIIHMSIPCRGYFEGVWRAMIIQNDYQEGAYVDRDHKNATTSFFNYVDISEWQIPYILFRLHVFIYCCCSIYYAISTQGHAMKIVDAPTGRQGFETLNFQRGNRWRQPKYGCYKTDRPCKCMMSELFFDEAFLFYVNVVKDIRPSNCLVKIGQRLAVS